MIFIRSCSIRNLFNIFLSFGKILELKNFRVKYFKKAIELGSKNALVTKFLQQIFGYIYEQKIEEPMKGIQDIADEGNPKAQAIIGMFHVSL